MSAQIPLTLSTLYGTGNHIAVLDAQSLTLANFWSWVGQVIAITSASLGRCSVLCLVNYVVDKTYRKSRYLWTVIVMCSVTINCVESGLIFVQCKPASKLWNQDLPGQCDLIELVSEIGYLQGSESSLRPPEV